MDVRLFCKNYYHRCHGNAVKGFTALGSALVFTNHCPLSLATVT
jgi:hypothetical protein